MKASKLGVSIIIYLTLFSSIVSFASDYPRLDKSYPSGNKIIFEENNKYGIKDNNFFTIINPSFDYISPYNGDYAISTYNGKKGVLDNKGNVHINNKFDDIIQLENNNFLAMNIMPGNLQYIFISYTKEEFLLNSRQRYYENGGRITDEFIGTLGDQLLSRKINPSKIDDLYFINNILKDTKYRMVDDIKSENYGQVLHIDNDISKDNEYFKLSYSSNLSPVMEINLWGKNLIEDTKTDIIVIENLTYELLRYYTESDYISGLIFDDIDYFMKSNKKGIKFNKTYNNINVYYDTTEKNGVKLNIRKN